MAVAEVFIAFVSTPLGLLQFISVFALLQCIFCETALKTVTAWVGRKDWWPRALPLQQAQMMNFGYPKDTLTEESTRGCFSYIVVVCGNHFLSGFLMLPVVIYGWTGAQTQGQACFILGALLDVSLDVYDELRMFLTTFFHEAIGKKLFGVEKCPKQFFIIIGVLHHPLAMSLVCPMLLYYPDMRSFHVIAVSLLLAAGICFLTGCYKYSLDMTRAFDWYQFKSIVFLQAVTILFTRGYIWFYHMYIVLNTFWADGSMKMFYGGCVVASLMSLFNFVMIADSLSAAAKWLPRSRVTHGSAEHDELNDDLARMVPPTMAKGTVKGTFIVSAALGLSPASTFRANIKVGVAAVKFKKALLPKH